MAYCKNCAYFVRTSEFGNSDIVKTTCNRHEFDFVEEENGIGYEIGEIDTTPYRKACEEFSKKEKAKWH